MAASAVVKANSQLQKGDDQKLDEIILQGVDGQALGNLSPAPQAICSIGLIMCVSLRRDFTLVEGGATAPREIRNPGSFRATLVQVAGESHDAFMEAHGNMQQLGLLMGTVPDHMKTAVTYLINKDGMSQQQMANQLQRELNSVQRVGDKCLTLAQETHSKFQHVGHVLGLVMELMVAKKGVSELQLEKAKQEKGLQEQRNKAVQQHIKKSEDEFNKLDANLKDAQKTLKEVMAAKPSGGDLIGAAFADAGCAFIKSIGPALTAGLSAYAGARGGTALAGLAAAGSTPGQAATGQAATGQAATGQAATGQAAPGGGAVDPAAQAQAAAANASIAGVVDMMMGHVEGLCQAMKGKADSKEERDGLAKQLRVTQENVVRLTTQAEMAPGGALAADVAALGKKVSDAMTQGKNALEQGSDKVKEMGVLADGLKKEAQTLVVKKGCVLPRAVLPPSQPFSGQVASGGGAASEEKGIATNMVDSWKFSVENARGVLRDTEKRRDHELQQLRALEERMVQENEKLARIKIEELTLDEIVEILQAAILHVGQCQEAWSRLIQLFIFIRNLTKFCCEKQLPDFVDLSKSVLGDVQRGDKIVACLKDQLYEMVVKTSQTAFAAQSLAIAYFEVSERHFLPALAGLSSIYALDADSPELTSKKAALMAQCKEASQAIAAKVDEQRQVTSQRIRDRMQAIDNQMVAILGEPEPEVKQLVASAAQEARQDPGYAAPCVVPVGLDADDMI